MTAIEFNTQFSQLSNLLNAFAYNLTRNSEDAKDLYQETACRALSNIDKFAPGTNFKAWLFTIMKNIFINNYRKKMKANTVSDSSETIFQQSAASRTTNNAAEASMLIKELQIMIDKLDDMIRVPFMMHYYGYKYQEIAEHLDLPLGTVKSRIFFARRELKYMIESDYGSTIAVKL